MPKSDHEPIHNLTQEELLPCPAPPCPAPPCPAQVLQEMLDMLRDQQNNFHASRLEVIIIILLMVDVVLMLFQLLSLFGIMGPSYRRSRY